MTHTNDLLLRTVRGEKTERTPVWLMRQAGRILPAYRAVRNQLKDFIELVKTPERAAEVTLQPVDRLGVDAAIIFSDILVVAEAMGLPYQMSEKKGPYFPQTIQNEQALEKLQVANVYESLQYVFDAIKITKQALHGRVPLIGFAGAPWTLLAYMVEGGGSKTCTKARSMLYTHPRLAHQLLQMITASTIDYLQDQINAGVDLVQLFDSWAGILPPAHYQIFSLKYITQICTAIQKVPIIFFAKGAYFARKAMHSLPCEVIGLDWNMDIHTSRALIGTEKTLQGNLDPCVLYGSLATIKQETIAMLEAFGPYKHIANLGHGVYPDTDPDKVKYFVATVQEYSRRLRPRVDR